MSRITQEARKRQAVVKLAIRKGNSYASRMYGVSLSSVKRRRKRYAVTWQKAEIEQIPIPPGTPWHNGKVERSRRNDQKYFYNWEKFTSVEDLTVLEQPETNTNTR